MRNVRVFGPAYLDSVSRADRPLLGRGTVDGSFAGILEKLAGPTRILDQGGGTLVLDGERGALVRLAGRLDDSPGPWSRVVGVQSAESMLGGMGAGFASALQGELVSSLGGTDRGIDDRGRWIARRLQEAGIAHTPLMVPGRESDWTWIISSGPFGDKLAIGFRGCHASVESLEPADLDRPCDLLVVAGFANLLVRQALGVPAGVRMLAPAMRNMRETDVPLASLAGRFDYLACNRAEWEALAGRDTLLETTPLVSVTDGPDGSRLSFHNRDGASETISLKAFPRDEPPRDTNRAGEAFAATFIAGVLDAGWTPGPIDAGLVRHAGLRASAAAALVLDLVGFGFPSKQAIDHALEAGRVFPSGNLDGPGLQSPVASGL